MSSARLAAPDQHDHLLGADVGEALADRGPVGAGAVADLDRARAQRREEALVPFEHAEVALAARQHDGVDLAGEGLAFRRDDVEGERHQTSRFAFSIASSMVPTM